MVSRNSVLLDWEQWLLYITNNQCLLCKWTGKKVHLHQHCPQTNEEPAVVALPLAVHEDTIEFNWARGPMVHLFGGELEVVMISWITYFSG